MTNIKNTYLTILLLTLSINLLFSGCANVQNKPDTIPVTSQQPTVSSTFASDTTPEESAPTPAEINVKPDDKITNKQPVEQTKKTAPNKANAAILTDDQIAMTADELLNDPDLISPIYNDGESNYNQSEVADFDDDDEYSTPEEINFKDDFDIPDFAQKLLDESYPQYYPPTGKLFGFMRRHLLMRGDSPKPWTVKDDFNGDNKPDWAGLMVNKEQQLDVIVIYSEDDKYRLEVLFEDAGIDNNSIKIALSQEKPGNKVGASYKNKPGKFRTATLEFPGINIMHYTKSSSLFYWDKYYFDELLTSK